MNMISTAKYRKVACKQVAGETMTDVTRGRGLKPLRCHRGVHEDVVVMRWRRYGPDVTGTRMCRLSKTLRPPQAPAPGPPGQDIAVVHAVDVRIHQL